MLPCIVIPTFVLKSLSIVTCCLCSVVSYISLVINSCTFFNFLTGVIFSCDACMTLIFILIFWLSIWIHNACPMLFSCCNFMLIVLMLFLAVIILPLLFIQSSLKTLSYTGIAVFSFLSMFVSIMHVIVGFVSSTVFVSESTFNFILLMFW